MSSLAFDISKCSALSSLTAITPLPVPCSLTHPSLVLLPPPEPPHPGIPIIDLGCFLPTTSLTFSSKVYAPHASLSVQPKPGTNDNCQPVISLDLGMTQPCYNISTRLGAVTIGSSSYTPASCITFTVSSIVPTSDQFDLGSSCTSVILTLGLSLPGGDGSSGGGEGSLDMAYWDCSYGGPVALGAITNIQLGDGTECCGSEGLYKPGYVHWEATTAAGGTATVVGQVWTLDVFKVHWDGYSSSFIADPAIAPTVELVFKDVQSTPFNASSFDIGISFTLSSESLSDPACAGYQATVKGAVSSRGVAQAMNLTFPVTLVKDGGVAGDMTSYCTYTYTAKNINTGSTIASGCAPVYDTISGHRTTYGERTIAVYGFGYYDASNNFTLFSTDEEMALHALAVMTSLSTSGTNITGQFYNILMHGDVDLGWSTVISGTDCSDTSEGSAWP